MVGSGAAGWKTLDGLILTTVPTPSPSATFILEVWWPKSVALWGTRASTPARSVLSATEVRVKLIREAHRPTVMSLRIEVRLSHTVSDGMYADIKIIVVSLL